MVFRLKEYKRFVLWVDYFNSTLSRAQGRRVSLDRAVKDPTLDELSEAVKRLSFEPESISAKHPARMTSGSGYVSIEKKEGIMKSQIISDVSKTLSGVRGERSTRQTKDKAERK